MREKNNPSGWGITTQSVYSFEREERAKSACEIVLPTDKIQLRGTNNHEPQIGENRLIRQSIK